MGSIPDALDEPARPEAPISPTGPPTYSSTELFEHTEVEEEETLGDGDRLAHFMRRDKADSSMVTSQPVIALCGKVWILSQDASEYPVYLMCRELRDSMGHNGRN